ncbi:hypothetical protein LIER_03955 [Lithospermum erythrorhizon]|uniref:Uncharacterized protein n=1 Tax=Lithospermum erythrorhizon TaxID=34254 RepID=A0AAV3NZN2_LITER
MRINGFGSCMCVATDLDNGGGDLICLIVVDSVGVGWMVCGDYGLWKRNVSVVHSLLPESLPIVALPVLLKVYRFNEDCGITNTLVLIDLLQQTGPKKHKYCQPSAMILYIDERIHLRLGKKA